jgi:hypothetical protein
MKHNGEMTISDITTPEIVRQDDGIRGGRLYVVYAGGQRIGCSRTKRGAKQIADAHGKAPSAKDVAAELHAHFMATGQLAGCRHDFSDGDVCSKCDQARARA